MQLIKFNFLKIHQGQKKAKPFKKNWNLKKNKNFFGYFLIRSQDFSLKPFLILMKEENKNDCNSTPRFIDFYLNTKNK